MKSIFTLLICLLTVLPLQSQFYNNRGRFEFARPYERTYRPKQKIQIRYDDAIRYTKPFNIHVDPGGLKDYSSSLVMNSYPTEEVENTDCYCHYESDFWKYEEALEEQLAHERKKWLENQEKILKEQIEERFDKKYSSFKRAQQEFFKEFAGYEDQPYHIKRFKEDVDKKSATSRRERDYLQSNHVVIHKAFENIINIHRGLNPKHELGDLRFPNGRRLDDRDYLSHLYNLMNYYHLGFYTFYQEAVSKNNEYHNYRALHHGAYIAENNDEMALHIANAYIKDYNSRDLGERVDVMTRYLINHALGFNKVPYKISEGFFRGVPYNYYTVKKYAEKHKPKPKSVMPSMDFETAKTHFALGQMDSGVSYTLRTFLFDETKLYLGLNNYSQASLTKLEDYFKGLREGEYRGGTTGLKGSRTTQNEDRPCRILSVRLSNGKQTGWEGFGNLLHKTSKLWDGDENPKPGLSVFNEIEGETIRKIISANGFQIPEGEFSNRDLGRLFDFEYSSGNYLRIGFSNKLASQIIDCEHGDGNYGWSLFTDPLKIQALKDLLKGEKVDFSQLDKDCNTSKADLKKAFPNISDSNAQKLADVLNNIGKDFGIDTKEKLQHFLAQASHETGGFNKLTSTESTYYSTASRLEQVWPSRFSQTDKTKKDPDDYIKNSSKLANFVYANRMGNGNEASGDGYKYRGRGIFQLTGKSNYQSFTNAYNAKYDPDKDFVANPGLLASDNDIAIISALWYYQNRVLNKITVDSNTSVTSVTYKVNGGDTGIKDRKTQFNKAKNNIDCK